MDSPLNWSPITASDLERFRIEVVGNAPKIELARTFLTITDGPEKANLEPALLLEIGNLLSDPKTLLSGPNLLIWQNQRRSRGDIS